MMASGSQQTQRWTCRNVARPKKLLLVPYEKVRPHHGFVLVKKYLCHAKKTSDIIIFGG
jgi:hypothetical protein